MQVLDIITTNICSVNRSTIVSIKHLMAGKLSEGLCLKLPRKVLQVGMSSVYQQQLHSYHLQQQVSQPQLATQA
jgi:hypothetical protein